MFSLGSIVEDSVLFQPERLENFIPVSKPVRNTLMFHLELKSGQFQSVSDISANFGKFQPTYKFRPVWLYNIWKKKKKLTWVLLPPASSMALLSAWRRLFFFFLQESVSHAFVFLFQMKTIWSTIKVNNWGKWGRWGRWGY